MVNLIQADRPLPVIYCFDKRYLFCAAVSTLSVLRQSTSPRMIYWMVPQSDVKEIVEIVENKGQLKNNIKIISSPDFLPESWGSKGHFSSAMFLRLFIPVVIPEPRALYIDADTLVVGDISELDQFELGNQLIAGVVDHPGGRTSQIPRSPDDPYLNSGVMLMNLNQMREEQFLDQCIHAYQALKSIATWPDQCLINKISEGRKVVLSDKWNKLVYANLTDNEDWRHEISKGLPKIIHFVGHVKPWHSNCNPVFQTMWKAHAASLEDLMPEVGDIQESAQSASDMVQYFESNGNWKRACELKGQIIRQQAELIQKLNLEIQQKHHLGAQLTAYRTSLSAAIADFHGNRVAYGPLKGFALSENRHWGYADRGGMILGMYEREILDFLCKNLGNGVLIDIGAADGYYGVGLVTSNYFVRSYCFEMSEAGRQSIDKSASINAVQDRVIIHEKADSNFFSCIPLKDRVGATLLIDIEGAEFDLLSSNVFREFNRSIIVVELHDWFFEDGAQKLASLLERSKMTHSVQRLVQGARNPGDFPELASLGDDSRWLVCSEGRGRSMAWLAFHPLQD